ncbi:hypothetical protein EDD18DRAFT_1112005 [Armillaria luteobubalina]|uniref:Uncharacterized protein n=1 Tax=Armillaria luteobubalina TaxID=153913 RepID=A0AA39ULX3_9AGAR|nr:hypothetical protein EDD18DRAFT_1112005 [Armillaria luteobubalina]
MACSGAKKKKLSFITLILGRQDIAPSALIFRHPGIIEFSDIGQYYAGMHCQSLKDFALKLEWVNANGCGIIGKRCASLPQQIMMAIISISPIAGTFNGVWGVWFVKDESC